MAKARRRNDRASAPKYRSRRCGKPQTAGDCGTRRTSLKDDGFGQRSYSDRFPIVAKRKSRLRVFSMHIAGRNRLQGRRHAGQNFPHDTLPNAYRACDRNRNRQRALLSGGTSMHSSQAVGCTKSERAFSSGLMLCTARMCRYQACSIALPCCAQCFLMPSHMG